MVNEEERNVKRFERWRGTIGLFLGPLIAVILFLLPMPRLTPQAHTLAAIIGWVVVWWVTEPIPIAVTALLGPILCVLTRVAEVKTVFASFADPIIFLFLGSFILAEAMAMHGLDKRFARSIISLKWVGRSTSRILFTYGAIAAFISMWISNTAATAIMFPIGLGIISAIADIASRQAGKTIDPKALRFGTGMMLMAAYGASVGGIGTPVGTPPNLIGIAMIQKYTGVHIHFFQWMAFAIPLLLIMYLFLFYLIRLVHRPEVIPFEGSCAFPQEKGETHGAWTRGQKNTSLIFIIVVILWLIPGFLAVFFGSDSSVYSSYNSVMPEGIAAMIGVMLLFLLPVDWKKRQFTITWQRAVTIDWGTLLLFGGGLTLGSLMFESRLADAIGSGLLRWSGAHSMWGITLASIYIAILVSEATSNTASANMVIPVIIALAQAARVNPIPPALGATLGASWGFMLPISTPPNAIVYGSGLIPITRMIKTGIIFDILGGMIIWLGLRFLLPLVGLG